MQQIEPYRRKRKLSEDATLPDIQIETDLLESEDYPKTKTKTVNTEVFELSSEKFQDKTYFVTDDMGRRKFYPNGVVPTGSTKESKTLQAVKEKLMSRYSITNQTYGFVEGNKRDEITKGVTNTKERAFASSTQGRGVTAVQVQNAQKEHLRKLNKWKV
jgi:hypothetical protein